MGPKDYVVVKYESHGERFEILVKPKEAMEIRRVKAYPSPMWLFPTPFTRM